MIPIGCLRHDASLGYFGIATGIFPAFSDSATQKRYRTIAASDPAQRARLRKQANEAVWMLGVPFTIQVVPGRDSEALHVLAGDAEAVSREAQRLYAQAWEFPVAARADLAVAAIAGDATQQTWENVGRALAAAAEALDREGAVVLCTDLAERIGPGLGRILAAEDLELVEREIESDRPPDALAALELIRAMGRGKVYLVSRLNDEFVEDMGLLPLAADQLSRLAARHGSCVVIPDAQFAWPRLESTASDLPLPKRKSRR